MASNILKNNGFGGPTYFDRRWLGHLPGQQTRRAELGWPSSRGEKGGPPSVKVAHVYVVLRYQIMQSKIYSELCQFATLLTLKEICS